ncbi:MAG: SBBP repeat-containing protein [Promethearchaeota archaeon]
MILKEHIKSKKKILIGIFMALILMGLLITNPVNINRGKSSTSINQNQTIKTSTITYVDDWAYGITDKNDYGWCIAIDSSNDLYIGGTTNETGELDVIIIKVDSDGNHLWNVTWGSPGPDVVHGIALDSSGNIYITGSTFGYGSGIYDLFIAKFNSIGYKQWNYTWGLGDPLSTSWGHSLIIDGNDIYIAGDADPGLGVSMDLALVKYNTAGTRLWNVTWGGSDSDYGWGIIKKDSTLYVVGRTDSYGAGNSDIALIKFSASNGALLDNVTWGGTGDDSGGDLLIIDDSIYIAGSTVGLSGYTDGVLLKYDLSLNLKWAQTWGNVGNENISSTKIANCGSSLYVTGTNSLFDPTIDVHLAQFNLSGSLLDRESWDSGDADLVGDIVVDSTNNNTYIVATSGNGKSDITLIKWQIDCSPLPSEIIPAFGIEFLLFGLLITLAIVLTLRKKSKYLPIE